MKRVNGGHVIDTMNDFSTGARAKGILRLT